MPRFGAKKYPAKVRTKYLQSFVGLLFNKFVLGIKLVSQLINLQNVKTGYRVDAMLIFISSNININVLQLFLEKICLKMKIDQAKFNKLAIF